MQKFLTIILLYLSVLIISPAISDPAYAQNAPASDTLYQQSQVIVQYEDGLAPNQLEADISQSGNSKKGIFPSVSKILTDIINTLVDKPSPREQLTDILSIEDKVGITDKSRMFDAGDESQSNTYLYTLDEGQTVENAITIFESAPYVKYAQPNYLYFKESQ